MEFCFKRDSEARALYLTVPNGGRSGLPVITLYESGCMDPGISVDYYLDGRLLGIELMHYCDYLSGASPLMNAAEFSGKVALKRSGNRIWFASSTNCTESDAERIVHLGSLRTELKVRCGFNAVGTLQWISFPAQIRF